MICTVAKTTIPILFLEDAPDSKCVLQDAVTGNYILLEDAPGVVNQFAMKAGTGLPTVGTEEAPQGTFVCKIVLPPGGPLKNPVTGAASTQNLARQQACFHVCRKLFKQGLLDHTLFPRRTTMTRNTAPSSANESSKFAKAVHLFPKKYAFFWTHLLGPSPKRLYSTIVSIETEHTDRHGSFTLLTKRPFPTLPPFAVFENGHRAVVRLQAGASFKPDQEQLTQLHGYSMRVFRAITNKPFSLPIEVLSYLVAPLRGFSEVPNLAASCWQFPDISNCILWKLVALGAEQWKVSLVSEDGTLVADDEETVIQDRAVEFTNRLYLRKVRHDMTPQSKIVDDNVSATAGFVSRP